MPLNLGQMLLKLMMNPYEVVPKASYGFMDQLAKYATRGFVQRIFRGDDSLMMGRPKFLSDQVYNKALFGSLTPTPYSFDEAGPPASGRMTTSYRRNAKVIGDATPDAGLVASGVQAVWGVADRTRRAGPLDIIDGVYANNRIYGALTYIGQPDENDPTGTTALKQVQLGPKANIKLAALDAVGKARFDTRIVRNLFFITNIQRLMRLKLNQELTQYRNVLVSNHSVINPGVTEYGYLPPSSTSPERLRVYGPGNETLGDRRYDNETRLVQ